MGSGFGTRNTRGSVVVTPPSYFYKDPAFQKIEKSKIDFKGGRSDFRSFCDRFLSQKILARFKRKILLFVCECRTHSFLVFWEMSKCAFIKILLGKTQKVTKVTQYQFCHLRLCLWQNCIRSGTKKSRPGWKKNSLSKTEKKSRTKPLRGTLYPWLFFCFGKSSDQRDGFFLSLRQLLFPCEWF